MPRASPKSTCGSPTSTRIRREARAARHPVGPGLRRGGAAARPRRRSPAAGGCAWRWPRCCFRGPTCCCSTSRPTISTSKARCGWRTSCARYPRHRAHHQPRPRPAQRGGQFHRASRSARKLTLLSRRLTTISSASAPSRRCWLEKAEEKQDAERAASASPSSTASAPRPPRRARRSRASRRWRRCSRSRRSSRTRRRRFAFPEPEKAAASPIIRLEQAPGRLCSRTSRSCATSTCASTRTTASRCWAPTATASRTFAKLLAGRLPCLDGGIVKAPGMKVAMFAQHQLDDLKPEERRSITSAR